MSRREILIWTLLALFLALGIDRFAPAPLNDDSYQYLSVADNVSHGRGISTSLIHFDTERAHGVVPAPMTTFAPAYPIVLGALSTLNGNAEIDARSLAILCFAALVPMLAGLANFLNIGVGGIRVGLIFLFANSYYWHSADSVLTEPLFTVVALGAVWALSVAAERGHWALFALGHFLTAAAYWVRYAGLFLFAAVLIYFFVVRPVMTRNPRVLLSAFWCALSGALIGLVMYRNLTLTGSWKGGNTKAVSNPLRSVIADYVRAQYHLLFGDQLRPDLYKGLAAGLCLGILIVAVVVAAKQIRSATFRPAALLLLTYAVMYTAGMIYLGQSSVITFGARMFYPLIPFYALALAYLFHGTIAQLGTKPAVALAFLMLIPYAVDNGRDLALPEPPALATTIRADAAPLSQWINSHIPEQEPVAAMSGQATGFVLHRPVISLVRAHFSDLRWNEPTLAAQMKRFHARYLILYKHLEDPITEDSQFIAQAVCCGMHPGFAVAAEDPDMQVLELTQP